MAKDKHRTGQLRSNREDGGCSTKVEIMLGISSFKKFSCGTCCWFESTIQTGTNGHFWLKTTLYVQDLVHPDAPKEAAAWKKNSGAHGSNRLLRAESSSPFQPSLSWPACLSTHPMAVPGISLQQPRGTEKCLPSAARGRAQARGAEGGQEGGLCGWV